MRRKKRFRRSGIPAASPTGATGAVSDGFQPPAMSNDRSGLSASSGAGSGGDAWALQPFLGDDTGKHAALAGLRPPLSTAAASSGTQRLAASSEPGDEDEEDNQHMAASSVSSSVSGRDGSGALELAFSGARGEVESLLPGLPPQWISIPELEEVDWSHDACWEQ